MDMDTRGFRISLSSGARVCVGWRIQERAEVCVGHTYLSGGDGAVSIYVYVEIRCFIYTDVCHTLLN